MGGDSLPGHVYKLTLCDQAIKTVKGIVQVSVPLYYNRNTTTEDSRGQETTRLPQPTWPDLFASCVFLECL